MVFAFELICLLLEAAPRQGIFISPLFADLDKENLSACRMSTHLVTGDIFLQQVCFTSTEIKSCT